MTERSTPAARTGSGKKLIGIFELPRDQTSEAEWDALAQTIAGLVASQSEEDLLPRAKA